MGSYENSYQKKGPSTAVEPRHGSTATAQSPVSQLLNNRPQSAQLRQLQSAMDVSPRVQQLKSLGRIVNGGVQPIQLVRGMITRPPALESMEPIQLLQGTVRNGPKNIHHQPFMIHSDDGRFFGVPFGVEVRDGDVVDFDADPNAFYLAANVVRVGEKKTETDKSELDEDEIDLSEDEIDLEEFASQYGEKEFDQVRKALQAAQKVRKVSSAIKFLTGLNDPAEVMGEIPGYDWLTLHRRLLAAGDLRKTPVKGGSQKLSRNRVKASVTLVIEDAEGRVRSFTHVIGKDFVSGESSSQSKVEAWLEEIERGPYDSSRHAHSEQDLGVFLRANSNLEGIVKYLSEGLEEGDRVSGFVLDIVSYPNTVCNECYPSIDETLAQYVVPFFEKSFKNKKLKWLVNASAVNLFPGVKSRPKSKGNWLEALVDYDQLGAEEEQSRQTDERSSRGQKRKSRNQSGSSSNEPKTKYPGQQAVRALAGRFATVERANGDGLACYIRSIMLGLAARGVIGANQVGNLVGAVTDHLANVNLRMDQTMIDAGGLAAAEVRRVIAQLTDHVLDGGVDVGISVVLWDPDSASFQHFVANDGTYQITLLYTPGHFDFLDM